MRDPVERVVETVLPTRFGALRALGYRQASGKEHLVLVLGDLAGREAPLARVHSECLTGDAFGSLRCDCGRRLEAALQAMAEDGSGVVVYLRGHDGHGTGPVATLGVHTRPDGTHTRGAAAAVLLDLGVTRVRLLTDDHREVVDLRRGGLDVRAARSRQRP